MRTCACMFIAPHRLFARKILDTYTWSRNPNNIFLLVILDKVMYYYKRYQSWPSHWPFVNMIEKKGKVPYFWRKRKKKELFVSLFSSILYSLSLFLSLSYLPFSLLSFHCLLGSMDSNRWFHALLIHIDLFERGLDLFNGHAAYWLWIQLFPRTIRFHHH